MAGGQARRGATAGLAVLLTVAACRASLNLTESDHGDVLTHHVLDAPDPGDSGSFVVERFYYGSGNDKNRAEYRDSVTLVTPSVDASKLLDLAPYREDERNDYWGFSSDSLPLNGRVWRPVGDGPFPLVLIVHGNHDMKDFSDPGYAYLGRLLASRGFILASVDMNFLNGFIREENDARGWLLLKHLEQWHRFNDEHGSPVRGAVDLQNIALIGHSRGGEAVANAAAFNRLSRYPDDAKLEFDFGYDIRSVISIAPVDGQYLPTGRKVVMRDVNYMVFHGSHDGDVRSFHGLRLYDRLQLSPELPLFKTAIYVYRANHGQFNERWGPNDNGPRSSRILDLRPLLDGEQQRRFARVYVSAFLEATLKGDDRYLPMFRDHRVIGGWLPPTMYVTRFQTSSFWPLATFEEDIDVTTGTAPGVTLAGDRLEGWKEGRLQLRSSNRATTSASQENQGVWLGWVREEGDPPSYAISLPATMAADLGLTPGWTLDLALSGTRRLPTPESDGEQEGPAPDESDEPFPPIDLTVEVEDADRRMGRVRLGAYGPIRRPLDIQVMRRRDLENQRYSQQWELVLQTYSIPLEDFVRDSPALRLERVERVRLVFDRAEAGEVVVDDIGFTELDPGFLRARVGDDAR